jgi:hypothetical protein
MSNGFAIWPIHYTGRSVHQYPDTQHNMALAATAFAQESFLSKSHNALTPYISGQQP